MILGGMRPGVPPRIPGFGGPFTGALAKGGCKGRPFDEEDWSRDWYCEKCRERNFARRLQCHKCGAEKPAEGCTKAPTRLQSGQTCNGMVKSYNKKGFGFIMLLDTENAQDLYYTRENLSPKLELRNIPGQNVTFEAHRFPDGKWAAVNIRPFGEDKADLYAARREAAAAGPAYFARQNAPYSSVSSGFSDRDAAGRPASASAPSRRNISPHAGSRAYKETLMAELGQRSANRRSDSPKRKRRRGGRSSESSQKRASSDSSSSEKKRRRKKKAKKRRKSSSSSSSGCVSVAENESASKAAEPSGVDHGPEIDKAKSAALEELLKLRDKPLDARMSDFRALLRKWHPDKNPDKTEVATAVFQFLQKGKSMLDTR